MLRVLLKRDIHDIVGPARDAPKSVEDLSVEIHAGRSAAIQIVGFLTTQIAHEPRQLLQRQPGLGPTTWELNSSLG